MDANGDVVAWGAPLKWGTNTNNCAITSIDDAGKTTLCHIPPGNPNNPQTIHVGGGAVNAHLAHGDYLGVCGGCGTVNYQSIEYMINNSNQLIRRVLDNNNALVVQDIFALSVTDFQAGLNANQKVVTLTATASGKSSMNVSLSRTANMNVYLRNK